MAYKVKEDILIKLISEGKHMIEIARILNVHETTIQRACKRYGIKSHWSYSNPDSRKLYGEKRREYFKNNPDKHPWKRSNKYKSHPCELFKKWLTSKGILFCEEFSPLIEQGRFYSIDVAFPELKIGIEINGNQHYEPRGVLKPYYQSRHDEIEASGWKLYEIHYSICYNLEKLENLLIEVFGNNKICK